MLDINFIRKNAARVRWAVDVKGVEVDIDRLLEIDAERRALLTSINEAREEQNRLSKKIQKLGKESRGNLVEEVKVLKDRLASFSDKFKVVDSEYNDLMLLVPGVPDPETPIGKTDSDNVEVSRWGDPPKFDFDVKDHVEIGFNHGLIEFERSRQYSGSRSYSLIGLGVMLERAVMQFALEYVSSKNFMPISPPILVREQALTGTGFFPSGRQDTYAIERDSLFLAGTSEVSLVAQHADEIINSQALPLRYVGISPCYRREAGAAGRDTRGLYRVHSFNKVEQVSIGPDDDDWSKQEQMLLLENSLEILRALGLPHRVALACTGEIGIGPVKKFEIESWMPSRASYSETHSCSALLDFQSRRANVRFRDASRKRPSFVYTLNNTAIASPRILIPLLECNQRRDGSVAIPKVLQRYMGGLEKIG